MEWNGISDATIPLTFFIFQVKDASLLPKIEDGMSKAVQRLFAKRRIHINLHGLLLKYLCSISVLSVLNAYVIRCMQEGGRCSVSPWPKHVSGQYLVSVNLT